VQTANDFKAVSGFISQKPVAEFSKRDRLSAVPAGTRPPPPRMWELHVTWGTPVQSFVFLGLLVFELEPMYATSDRRTDDGRR